jgi:hypothetical protein
MKMFRIAETVTVYRGESDSQLSAIYAVGTHYSTRPEIAELYGESNEHSLNLNKPYHIDASKHGHDYSSMLKDHFSTDMPNVITHILLNNGYDALIVDNAQIGRGSLEFPSSEIIVLPTSFELSDQLEYMYKGVLDRKI